MLCSRGDKTANFVIMYTQIFRETMWRIKIVYTTCKLAWWKMELRNQLTPMLKRQETREKGHRQSRTNTKQKLDDSSKFPYKISTELNSLIKDRND